MLVLACELGNKKLFTMILDSSNVNKKDKDSNGNETTPLIVSALKGRRWFVESLLREGADPSVVDAKGNNALHVAAAHNSTTNIVSLLLFNMQLKDINKLNNDGYTPLDLCYEKNNSEVYQDIADLISTDGGITTWNNTKMLKKRGDVCLKSLKQLPRMIESSKIEHGVDKTKYTYTSFERTPKRRKTSSDDEVINVIIEEDESRPNSFDAYLYKYEKNGKVVFNHLDVIDGLIKKVKVHYEHARIEILLVYTGNGKGICTKAVAYTMKALIDHVNKQNKFALRGSVTIESKYPCSAFNCYNRAFELNGFVLEDKTEYNAFRQVYDTKDSEYITFIFDNYVNKSQELKKERYEAERMEKNMAWYKTKIKF